jgi:hypothetical protein
VHPSAQHLDYKLFYLFVALWKLETNAEVEERPKLAPGFEGDCPLEEFCPHFSPFPLESKLELC